MNVNVLIFFLHDTLTKNTVESGASRRKTSTPEANTEYQLHHSIVKQKQVVLQLRFMVMTQKGAAQLFPGCGICCVESVKYNILN